MGYFFCKNTKKSLILSNPLIDPQISNCENLKILLNDLPYYFLQSTIIRC